MTCGNDCEIDDEKFEENDNAFDFFSLLLFNDFKVL